MKRKFVGPALSIAVILLGLFAVFGTLARQDPNGADVESGSATVQVGATQTDSPTPPVKTITPTSTVTPTPSPPIAAADRNAFCRFGPGQYYAPTGELLAGASSPISGRNEESTWWLIAAAYEGGACWISDSVVTVSGEIGNLEVVDAPPLVPLAPVPIRPSGKWGCDPQLPHMFLRWEPVDNPFGIALYEWQIQGPDGWESGTTTDTSLDYVVTCGEKYLWHVRAIDNEGTTGPYSEYMQFEME
jgi:hypothetical protein